ncbi:amino acid ABC transporter permease [Apilactobacillus apisilvae]|uniref:Amino acid ABC transporter permease n=1 Tax=Apilactobacillus apisilvae TaxID=2923364 RepID=A0ABY4PI78_9LACO|nr:amino acid ABC transporter permease [Apilactobacillus apisilvae]UQS85179.1 amino acid ABC transporter permease [Apilactobacillus apisilvae]
MKYVFEILPSLFSGVVTTLEIFGLTLLISIPLGIVVSLALTGKKIIKSIFAFYVWIMRGTPLLLQLIFIFYGLPIIGVVFPRFEAALIAFSLNYAAYFAEIFRGGFQSIPQNQFESAKMLRLSRWQTLRKIVIPQVVKIVLPSIGNEVINLVKDSSLVYVIGIGDLLQAGNIATARDVTLLPLILVAVFYLILTAILTFILRRLEKSLNYWK